MPGARMSYKEAVDLAVNYCEGLRGKGASSFIPRNMCIATGIKETAVSNVLLGVNRVRVDNVVLCSVDSLLKKYGR